MYFIKGSFLFVGSLLIPLKHAEVLCSDLKIHAIVLRVGTKENYLVVLNELTN